MTTRLYTSALAQRWTGYDVTGADDLTVALVDSTYTFDAAHNFFDDITGVLGTPEPLSTVAVVGGDLTADDVAAYTGVTLGDVVKGIVVYNDTGVAGTSKLLGFIDKNADTTPISLTSTGVDISIPWPGGVVATLVPAGS